MIVGLYGCLRTQNLLELSIEQVKKQGSSLHFQIPVTKNGNSKSFIIDKDMTPIVGKYINLRPANILTTRFFIRYSEKNKISYKS